MTLNGVMALFCVNSANSGTFRAYCVNVHVRYLISWWVLVNPDSLNAGLCTLAMTTGFFIQYKKASIRWQDSAPPISGCQSTLWTSAHAFEVRWTLVLVCADHARACNGLPSSLQELTDTKTFKRKLKTCLFQQAYNWPYVLLSRSFLPERADNCRKICQAFPWMHSVMVQTPLLLEDSSIGWLHERRRTEVSTASDSVSLTICSCVLSV